MLNEFFNLVLLALFNLLRWSGENEEPFEVDLFTRLGKCYRLSCRFYSVLLMSNSRKCLDKDARL